MNCVKRKGQGELRRTQMKGWSEQRISGRGGVYYSIKFTLSNSSFIQEQEVLNLKNTGAQ